METKVILVDSVPVICAECDYAEILGDIRGDRLWCCVKKKVCHTAKPDWCPIKSLPEKLNEEDIRKKAISKDCYDGTELEDWYISGKVRGWNSLLETLLNQTDI